jgi:hypothetical protein
LGLLTHDDVKTILALVAQVHPVLLAFQFLVLIGWRELGCTDTAGAIEPTHRSLPSRCASYVFMCSILAEPTSIIILSETKKLKVSMT